MTPAEQAVIEAAKKWKKAWKRFKADEIGPNAFHDRQMDLSKAVRLLEEAEGREGKS